jgi:hypothetical protein
MAGHSVVWLGDNASRALTDPASGKKVGVGGTITLDDGQIKALRRAGHRFATPQSEEGKAAKEAAGQKAPTP